MDIVVDHPQLRLGEVLVLAPLLLFLLLLQLPHFIDDKQFHRHQVAFKRPVTVLRPTDEDVGVEKTVGQHVGVTTVLLVHSQRTGDKPAFVDEIRKQRLREVRSEKQLAPVLVLIGRRMRLLVGSKQVHQQHAAQSAVQRVTQTVAGDKLGRFESQVIARMASNTAALVVRLRRSKVLGKRQQQLLLRPPVLIDVGVVEIAQVSAVVAQAAQMAATTAGGVAVGEIGSGRH